MEREKGGLPSPSFRPSLEVYIPHDQSVSPERFSFTKERSGLSHAPAAEGDSSSVSSRAGGGVPPRGHVTL